MIHKNAIRKQFPFQKAFETKVSFRIVDFTAICSRRKFQASHFILNLIHSQPVRPKAQTETRSRGNTARKTRSFTLAPMFSSISFLSL